MTHLSQKINPFRKKVEILLEKAVSFIAAEQSPDGSFVSLSWPCDSSPDRSAYRYTTTFQASLVLSALSGLAKTDSAARIICQKSAHFLLREKNGNWSWNYWAWKSPEETSLPYPDDLDDTFLAFSALHAFDEKLVGPEGLAAAIKLLVALEVRPGGPYRTWLTSKSKSSGEQSLDSRPDIVVNANVAYFLSLHDITLPSLTAFFEKSLRAKKLESAYYPSIYSVAYFIGRICKGKSGTLLLEMLDDPALGNGGSVLLLSVRLSIFIRLAASEEKILRCLRALLKKAKDGWKAEAFCVDPTRGGRTHHGGSAALTAALTAEALRLFIQNQEDRKCEECSSLKDTILFRDKIISDVRKLFKHFDATSKKHILARLDSITKNDTGNEITLLSYFFSASFFKKQPNSQLKTTCRILGVATLCGWLAYSIFDNVLDNSPPNKAAASLLIPALTCLRELSQIYASFPNPEVKILFDDIMRRSDQAHNWELRTCHFKVESGICHMPHRVDFEDFLVIAEKSLGHALGPLTLLLMSGHKSDSIKVTTLFSFFTHYLIARQLNDDAHDWQEDLEAGHITPATNLMFQIWKQRYPTAQTINLKKFLPLLREIFWEEIIPTLCEKIIEHSNQALDQLAIVSLADPTYFIGLVNRQKSSAEKALRERLCVKSLLGNM